MLAVLALQAPFSWLGKCRAWDNMKPLPLHVCGKQVEKSDFHCEFPNAKEISEHGSFLCAREGEGHFATELVPVSLSRPFAPNLRFSLSLSFCLVPFNTQTYANYVKTTARLQHLILMITRLTAQAQGTLTLLLSKWSSSGRRAKRWWLGRKGEIIRQNLGGRLGLVCMVTRRGRLDGRVLTSSKPVY